MFSYRHVYHAGNHADVLKHWVVDFVARYMAEKNTPFLAIDTHAGAGLYSIDAGPAKTSGEATNGIMRIAAARALPAALAAYLENVRAWNHAISKQDRLNVYPGSPLILKTHLRAHDGLRLFELHPTDAPLLTNTIERLVTTAAERRRQVVRAVDGFDGLRSLLPPVSRRGLILIDPAYEDKQDYRRVAATLTDALSRFSSGTYLIWHPLVARLEAQRLADRLPKIAGDRPWLSATLTVASPRRAGDGGTSLTASAMFVVNPPFTLEAMLRTELPMLTQLLAQDAGALWQLNSNASTKPKSTQAFTSSKPPKESRHDRNDSRRR